MDLENVEGLEASFLRPETLLYPCASLPLGSRALPSSATGTVLRVASWHKVMQTPKTPNSAGSASAFAARFTIYPGLSASWTTKARLGLGRSSFSASPQLMPLNDPSCASLRNLWKGAQGRKQGGPCELSDPRRFLHRLATACPALHSTSMHRRRVGRPPACPRRNPHVLIGHWQHGHGGSPSTEIRRVKYSLLCTRSRRSSSSLVRFVSLLHPGSVLSGRKSARLCVAYCCLRSI